MILKKKQAVVLVNDFVTAFKQRYSGWETSPTPEIVKGDSENTDEIILVKKHSNDTTYLMVSIGLDFYKSRYVIGVGWADSLPWNPPDMMPTEKILKTAGTLEYLSQEEQASAFLYDEHNATLGNLIKPVGFRRYQLNSYNNSKICQLIFEDLESYGIEFWKVMLKRRFNIDKQDLTL